jgi:hypothetical protein
VRVCAYFSGAQSSIARLQSVYAPDVLILLWSKLAGVGATDIGGDVSFGDLEAWLVSPRDVGLV